MATLLKGLAKGVLALALLLLGTSIFHSIFSDDEKYEEPLWRAIEAINDENAEEIATIFGVNYLSAEEFIRKSQEVFGDVDASIYARIFNPVFRRFGEAPEQVTYLGVFFQQSHATRQLTVEIEGERGRAGQVRMYYCGTVAPCAIFVVSDPE